MADRDLKALLKKLNPQCTRALESAAGICVSRGNYQVSVEHMLLVFAEDEAGDVQAILRHFEIDPALFRRQLERAVEDLRSGHQGRPVFSPLLIQWIEEAWVTASVDMGLGEVRSGVLLAALVDNAGRFAAGDFVDLLGAVRAGELKRDLDTIAHGSKEASKPLGAAAATQPTAGAAGPSSRGADSALGRFCEDITEKARQGRIDPVFCRDAEIRQMIDILGRRRKNNPICVGEAGVGKSAVVEGLALKIVEGDVPDMLKEVDLLGLDLQLLQAGASVKGEFENRLKSVMDEVKGSEKPVILFIDEVHTLIGAGGAQGTGDAANIIKPALARGEMRTIAATTFSEYKRYIDKDAALARRFQLVKLDEPSAEDAVTIIRGLRKVYEKAHGVYVRDDAVAAAATLSDRYVAGRQLPDKAIDVLDTAATRVKLSVSAKPAAIDDKEKRIAVLKREAEALGRDIEAHVCEDDGRLAELDAEIQEVETALHALSEQWQAEKDKVEAILARRKKLAALQLGEPAPETAEEEAAEPLPDDPDTLKAELKSLDADLKALQGEAPLIFYEVGPDVVARVIGDWTGIPIGNMVKDEAAQILRFKDDLAARVKGQDHAIAALDEGIRAAKAGVNNPDQPIGVFLFVGPSGVGKTEMALGIAEILFGGERFMTTINMSEFQEKHTVSRLIGSPPGYVGYGEGGRLTEAVRQRPYSVVLLDEVEKADLEVMNLFYQVFDKGVLSDGEGQLVNFRNTVVILTSNLASDIITQMCAGEELPDIDTLSAAIRPVLSNHFKPALLARMRVVPFFNLKSDVIRDITALKLGKVAKRLHANQGIAMAVDEAVIDAVAARCTEVETGARNIDHIINQTMLPAISTRILEMMSEEARPDRLTVALGDEGRFTYTFN
ncbi:MAG: type VI secretion system ATPase TssH [Rhodothalassiaceae bacterium]